MNVSLWSGLAGAATVNLANETARRFLPDAPRMDLVGEHALTRILRAVGAGPLKGRKLYAAALAGDLISNTGYYGAVARSSRPVLSGLMLGAMAGAGAVGLTPKLGLGKAEVQLTPRTAWLTFGWYLAGGLVAGVLARVLAPHDRLATAT